MSLVLLWSVIGMILGLSLAHNGGHLVYDVDDPYIHMAIAKHFAQFGVWGVTPYQFSSSSSSILWPLLLSAIYRVVGVNEISPLLLTIIFSTLMLLSIGSVLNSYRPCPPSLYILLTLSAIIFLIPLPALVFSGHEHVLHALVTILFTYLAARVLSEPRPGASTSRAWLLCGLAPLVTLIRWEGLFLVFVVCALFLVRKQWLYAVLLGALSTMPAAIYGIISTANGWFWLPNSVLLKGKMPSIGSVKDVVDLLGYSLYNEFLATPHLLLLTLTALSLYILRFRKQKGVWENGQVMLVILIGVTFLHVLFVGRARWFYRHDAYLVALGLFVISATFVDHLPRVRPKIWIERRSMPQSVALLILALVLVLPIIQRGAVSFLQRAGSTLQVAQATTNIYQQQYQMGLFLKEFYTGASVAANDIGAIDYLADVNILDLYGLGTLQVARWKRYGDLNTEQIRALATSQGTKVAIVYDRWFQRDGVSILPSEWTQVAQWTIRNNVVASDDTVSFYSVDPSEDTRLIQNLKQFALRLPPQVKQRGKYVELPTSSFDLVPKNIGRATTQE